MTDSALEKARREAVACSTGLCGHDDLEECEAAIDRLVAAAQEDNTANDHVAECQEWLVRHGLEAGADGSVIVGMERLLERVAAAREEGKREAWSGSDDFLPHALVQEREAAARLAGIEQERREHVCLDPKHPDTVVLLKSAVTALRAHDRLAGRLEQAEKDAVLAGYLGCQPHRIYVEGQAKDVRGCCDEVPFAIRQERDRLRKEQGK